jgi:hypothetical protein
MALSLFGLKPIQLLLVVLVVANVAMLTVHWLKPSEDDRRGGSSSESPAAEELGGAAAAEGVAPVRLLSERPSAASIADEPVADVEPPPLEDGTDEPPREPAVSELVAADAAAVAIQVPAEPEQVTGTGVSGPDGAAHSEGASAGGVVSLNEAAEAGPKAAGAESEETVCRVWGPFNDLAEAEAVAADLGLDGAAYQVVDEEITGSPDFLVYIDHGGDREAARRVVEELRTQGIEGYIMRGRFNDAVSIGVFSLQDRATRQQERVAAMGYAPHVEVLERTQRVYYLAAQVPPLASDRGGPNKPCSDIAPVRDIL